MRAVIGVRTFAASRAAPSSVPHVGCGPGSSSAKPSALYRSASGRRPDLDREPGSARDLPLEGLSSPRSGATGSATSSRSDGPNGRESCIVEVEQERTEASSDGASKAADRPVQVRFRCSNTGIRILGPPPAVTNSEAFLEKCRPSTDLTGDRVNSANQIQEDRFAADSLLEESRFEPSVPATWTTRSRPSLSPGSHSHSCLRDQLVHRDRRFESALSLGASADRRHGLGLLKAPP
jgi:hypothetical protein